MLRLFNRRAFIVKSVEKYVNPGNVRLPNRQISINSISASPRGVDSRSVKNITDDKLESPAPLSIGSKYKPFDDREATVIENTIEEIKSVPTYIDDHDEFDGISLQHGVRGVFDIEDLVSVLRRENVKHIFTCAVPEQFNYVEYICIVTCKSPRHLLAVAEFIRKLYKRKMRRNDIIPKIEGKTSKDWMALDLGNIVLHVFTEKARHIYNLEILWGIGPEYDPQSQIEEQTLLKYAERHSEYLKGLKPAE